MKMFSKGFLNRFVDADDKRLKRPLHIDNMNLVLITKHNPYKKPIQIRAKSLLNDPEISLLTFQRVCEE